MSYDPVARTNSAKALGYAEQARTVAQTSATSALAASGAAQDAATAASKSADTAGTAATMATGQAAAAKDSASAAAASATAAAASADTATARAAAASLNAIAAQGSAASATGAATVISRLYLGSAAADPVQNADGSALQTGALYYNTALGVPRMWTGTAWSAAYATAGTLMTANNLSDLASAASARVNLGLGTVATLNVDTDSSMAANSDALVPSQAAVAAYVQTKLSGLSWKGAVRVATRSAATLATSFAAGQSVDGVTLAVGDRVLVKDQASGAENGIYVVTAGAPVRAPDANSGAGMVDASVYVAQGATNGDTQWTCTTNAPIALGSSALTFVQISTGFFTGGTLTSKLTTVASTASTAGFNIPVGTAPASPAEGDLWNTADGLFCQAGGTTRQVAMTTMIAPGGWSGLKVATLGASNSTSVITANWVTLVSGAGQAYVAKSVNVSVNVSTTGVGGSDGSIVTGGTWYNLFVIYNPSTQTVAGLFSYSATAPTLPNGYTHFARVGTVRTQDASPYYLLQTLQYGRRVQYVVASGTNLTALPVITTGSFGSPTTPTWVAYPLASYVPGTACTFIGHISPGASTSGQIIVAPNNSYGKFGSSLNAPPYQVDHASGITGCSVPINMMLEGTSLYAASSGGGYLVVSGWEENL